MDSEAMMREEQHEARHEHPHRDRDFDGRDISDATFARGYTGVMKW